MAAECQVCSENPSKYKCPTCTIPYCSLNCYKKHKEKPCQKPTLAKALSESAPKPERSTAKTTPIDDDEVCLTFEQLKTLEQSDAVRNYLEYPQIRELISKIDSSNDPVKLLDQARQSDPVFVELLDDMLHAVTGKKPGEEDA